MTARGPAPFRVTLCTALWGRPALTAVWWVGVRRLIATFARYGIACSVVVGGSQEDHRELALAAGATWVRIRNQPLGRKWNAIVETAGLIGTDYLLILGSDDFLSDAILCRYATLIRQGWLYLGLRGIYFYEIATGRLALFDPKRHATFGHPIGAGRLIHSDLLEPVHFRPWQDTLDRRLDASMTRRCHLPLAKLIGVDSRHQALDVKSGVNLWSFDDLHARYPRLRIVGRALDGIPEWPTLTRLALAPSRALP